MDQPALLARLRDGRSLPIESCDCRHCGNEWFMAALSPEWMPSHCPYCGIQFVGRTTDGEPGEFSPAEPWRLDLDLQQAVEERDAAQDAADKMASLILGEPIDWAFHDDAWRRAIDKLESP